MVLVRMPSIQVVSKSEFLKIIGCGSANTLRKFLQSGEYLEPTVSPYKFFMAMSAAKSRKLYQKWVIDQRKAREALAVKLGTKKKKKPIYQLQESS